MTNNMEIPMNSFSMTGTWYNPRTGEKFTVKDMYFQDNEPVVMTTDGRQIPYSVFEGYVQAPVDEHGNVVMPSISSKPPQPALGNLNDPLTQPIQPMSAQFSATEDILPDYGVVTPQVVTESTKKSLGPNYKIIDKALKHCSIPTVKLQFVWQNLPKKQVSALLDVMEVPLDEIIDYLYGEIMDDIVDTVKGQLKDFVTTKFGDTTK